MELQEIHHQQQQQLPEERTGVALSPNSFPQILLNWSLQNCVQQGNRELIMVYVRPPLRSIPTPVGKVPISHVSKQKLAEYLILHEAKTEDFCQGLQSLCQEFNVKGTFVIVGSDHVAKALVEQIQKHKLTTFILGASRNSLVKIRPGISDYVLKHAPEACAVQCISKSSKLVSVREAAKNLILPMRSPVSPRQDSFSSMTDEDEESSAREILSLEMQVQEMDEICYQPQTPELVEPSLNPPASSSQLILRNPENEAEDVEMLKRRLQRVISSAEMAKEAANTEAARCKEAREWAVKKAEEMAILRAQEQKRREAAVMVAELANKKLEEASQKHSQAVSYAESMKTALENEIQNRKAAEENRTMITDAAAKCREFSYEEVQAMTSNFSQNNKLGEGRYGHVYKGSFHHTEVAVKVLKWDGWKRLKEIEAVSQAHHPHIVLLLGANLEHGCLVYEYLENGSLKDRLLGTNDLIPCYKRLTIAVEVATAIVFLHNANPQLLVHPHLTLASILLDRNFNAKVSDLTASSRNLPDLESYKSAAETLAYVDPECRKSDCNTLPNPKSDVYAFGIILLQIITAASPVDLVEKVSLAVDGGCLTEILDQSAGDWSLETALQLACIGLRCTENQSQNRPEMEAVLDMLKKMKDACEFCEDDEQGKREKPAIFQCPILQEIMEYPVLAADGYTYEYEAIKRWLERNDTSPMTNLRLEHKTLTANRLVRSAICEWKLSGQTLKPKSATVSQGSIPSSAAM